jgi:hypothetical protein
MAATPSGVALIPTMGIGRSASSMASSAPSAMKSLAASTPSILGSTASQQLAHAGAATLAQIIAGACVRDPNVAALGQRRRILRRAAPL